MTEPENFAKHLSTLTAKDWKPLFELLPKIRSTKEFGKLVDSQPSSDGAFTFPYWAQGEVVSSFFDIAYDLGIVLDFDWPDWKEGAKILNNPAASLEQYDVTTLCKLITLILRKDRFNEGLLVNCFATGTMEKIINALQRQIEHRPV